MIWPIIVRDDALDVFPTISVLNDQYSRPSAFPPISVLDDDAESVASC
jgi:hypothetical protein